MLADKAISLPAQQMFSWLENFQISPKTILSNPLVLQLQNCRKLRSGVVPGKSLAPG